MIIKEIKKNTILQNIGSIRGNGDLYHWNLLHYSYGLVCFYIIGSETFNRVYKIFDLLYRTRL